MKPVAKTELVHALAVSIFALLVSAVGCSRVPGGRPESELRILCGSSMATPVQEIVPVFKGKDGPSVLLDLGGSETLLPRIVAGGSGDIFICHDPFEQKIKESGNWAGAVPVGFLKPVLLVRPGNPNHIQSVGDLTNRNLKIGMGDPRYSTCGELFVGLLDKKGLRDAVMKQVTMMGRTHTEIAQGLLLGPLDVVVVWNYIARLYSNSVEVVETQDDYPKLKVTVVGLKRSDNPKGRDAFLEFCGTDEVRNVFARHGYGPR